MAEKANQAVGIPILAGGRMNNLDIAEKAIADGKIDAVVLGRAALADPEYPFKILTGHTKKIRPCIACNQGCITRLQQGKQPTCAVNPAAMNFVKSVAEGNSSYAKKLFTEDAVLFGYFDGELEHGSIEQFYHNVDTVSGGENFKARIDVVDVEKSMAVVRVLEQGWGGRIDFTDYLRSSFAGRIYEKRGNYKMNKKIMVITGSPRNSGNSFAMTEAFIRAAEAKGHIVTRFDAAMKKVGGCHACETCYSTGKACTFDDDFNTIADDILGADVIVFSTPVYWYSIPAQIKGVIDKIFSFVVGGKDISGKECILITCCEEDDMSVMDGVRIPIERSAALNKWKIVGEVLIPGVLNIGDIKKTDGCKKAAALADII